MFGETVGFCTGCLGTRVRRFDLIVITISFDLASNPAYIAEPRAEVLAVVEADAITGEGEIAIRWTFVGELA